MVGFMPRRRCVVRATVPRTYVAAPIVCSRVNRCAHQMSWAWSGRTGPLALDAAAVELWGRDEPWLPTVLEIGSWQIRPRADLQRFSA